MSEIFYVSDVKTLDVYKLGINDIQMLALFATTIESDEEIIREAIQDKYIMLSLYGTTKEANSQILYELDATKHLAAAKEYFIKHKEHELYDIFSKLNDDFGGRMLLSVLIQLFSIEKDFREKGIDEQNKAYYVKMIDEYRKILAVNKQMYNSYYEEENKKRIK